MFVSCGETTASASLFLSYLRNAGVDVLPKEDFWSLLAPLVVIWLPVNEVELIEAGTIRGKKVIYVDSRGGLGRSPGHHEDAARSDEGIRETGSRKESLGLSPSQRKEAPHYGRGMGESESELVARAADGVIKEVKSGAPRPVVDLTHLSPVHPNAVPNAVVCRLPDEPGSYVVPNGLGDAICFMGQKAAVTLNETLSSIREPFKNPCIFQISNHAVCTVTSAPEGVEFATGLGRVRIPLPHVGDLKTVVESNLGSPGFVLWILCIEESLTAARWLNDLASGRTTIAIRFPQDTEADQFSKFTTALYEQMSGQGRSLELAFLNSMLLLRQESPNLEFVRMELPLIPPVKPPVSFIRYKLNLQCEPGLQLWAKDCEQGPELEHENSGSEDCVVVRYIVCVKRTKGFVVVVQAPGNYFDASWNILEGPRADQDGQQATTPSPGRLNCHSTDSFAFADYHVELWEPTLLSFVCIVQTGRDWSLYESLEAMYHRAGCFVALFTQVLDKEERLIAVNCTSVGQGHLQRWCEYVGWRIIWNLEPDTLSVCQLERCTCRESIYSRGFERNFADHVISACQLERCVRSELVHSRGFERNIADHIPEELKTFIDLCNRRIRTDAGTSELLGFWTSTLKLNFAGNLLSAVEWEGRARTWHNSEKEGAFTMAAQLYDLTLEQLRLDYGRDDWLYHEVAERKRTAKFESRPMFSRVPEPDPWSALCDKEKYLQQRIRTEKEMVGPDRQGAGRAWALYSRFLKRYMKEVLLDGVAKLFAQECPLLLKLKDSDALLNFAEMLRAKWSRERVELVEEWVDFYTDAQLYEWNVSRRGEWPAPLRQPQCFISHHGESMKSLVFEHKRLLELELNDRGVSDPHIFVDRFMEIGSDNRAEILGAALRSPAVIAFLNLEYYTSKWCVLEWLLARGRKLQNSWLVAVVPATNTQIAFEGGNQGYQDFLRGLPFGADVVRAEALSHHDSDYLQKSRRTAVERILSNLETEFRADTARILKERYAGLTMEVYDDETDESGLDEKIITESYIELILETRKSGRRVRTPAPQSNGPLHVEHLFQDDRRFT
eukprot:Plantae.Rhodophyta-Rhodochaete_pulchella.ctg487.p1 GENE.Plantae.Rhodophyta-Rhodochaete_pulchella.ctg487~~Plantae.Rhodophyta-Rhodochaete_pulchella.ctg487.p1  ORF type:complete len:1065 (-),score=141.33 Plantae.Rhodophyta-Rhodochaete_pulchella.ctg487:1766-4960(-)